MCAYGLRFAADSAHRKSGRQSGNDEAVPKHVDKQALLGKWIKLVKRQGGAVDEKHTGIVSGAIHNYQGQEVQTQELVERVVGFVKGL